MSILLPRQPQREKRAVFMDFGNLLPLGLAGCIVVGESQVRRCVDDHFQVESYRAN